MKPTQGLDDSPFPSLDLFWRGFTHDLRSPLFALLGYLQLIQNQLDHASSAKAREYLRLAREAGLRLDQMVAEMLEVFRFQGNPAPLKVEEVSLRTLFQRLWTTFSVLAQEKGISLRLVLKDDQALSVRGDGKCLERALENLLTNAIKFSVSGGTVVLTGHRAQGRVLLEVADQGRGIPLSEQARIFEPFSQVYASDRSMGFGLGLSIVQFIAKAHGGGIELVSGRGKGSRFTLWIPESR